MPETQESSSLSEPSLSPCEYAGQNASIDKEHRQSHIRVAAYVWARDHDGESPGLTESAVLLVPVPQSLRVGEWHVRHAPGASLQISRPTHYSTTPEAAEEAVISGSNFRVSAGSPGRSTYRFYRGSRLAVAPRDCPRFATVWYSTENGGSLLNNFGELVPAIELVGEIYLWC
jgi:hypothetical protein